LRLFYFLLTFLCGAALAVSAQENLVDNAGFEAAPARDGSPGGGWWLAPSGGQTTATVDRTVAHSGAASVRMASNGGEKCVLVCKKFTVASGDSKPGPTPSICPQTRTTRTSA
jgi:hypothetical protein